MAITVAVYGPNLRTTAEQLHVHRPGCADTGKSIYRGHQPWTVDAASVQDLVHAIYDPGDFCYDADAEWERYLDDVKVFPCVPDLPQTNQPEGETTMAKNATTDEFLGAVADVLNGADPEATADRLVAGAATPVPLPSALVREATADALKLLPAGSKSRVDGEVLHVAGGEGQAVVDAITEHMRAIVKANRSANMYREGKLRQVRSAVLEAVPGTAKPGAVRAAAPATKTAASKGKGADRIATLNAKKAAAKAARDAGHPIPDEQLKSMTAEQADKVAEARRTHKGPAAKAS